MSIDRFARIERALPGLFDELADAHTPDYLEAAIERASARPQRPSWTFPERWLPVELVTSRVPTTRMPWRQLGVLALIALLLATALAVYVGSHQPKLPAPFGPAANGLITYRANGDIFVGDPATGATRVVVGGPEDDAAPGYSADGTWIAFLRNSSGSTFDLYVIRPDGSDLRRLTSQPISNQTWINWAPDSQHLAMIEGANTAGACGSTACRSGKLDLIDLAGKVTTIASADGMSFVQFRPPDGREILYRAVVDGKWGLFAMDADGAHPRTIVPATVPLEMGAAFENVAYSPDGRQVFFQMYTDDPSNPGCCQLFAASADGGDVHRLVANNGLRTWDGVPSVSPDGRWIAFWHNLPDQPVQHLAVIRSDGTGPIIETGPDLSAFPQYAWAPDSSKILMVQDAGTTVYLLDPAGGPWDIVPIRASGELDWQRLAVPG